VKSKASVKTGDPSFVKHSISQCFSDGGKASFSLSARNSSVCVEIEAQSNGVMRACVDSVYRLAMLSEKIRSR